MLISSATQAVVEVAAAVLITVGIFSIERHLRGRSRKLPQADDPCGPSMDDSEDAHACGSPGCDFYGPLYGPSDSLEHATSFARQ